MAGPLLVTKDVPVSYDPTRQLTASSWLENQRSVRPPNPETAPIRLPVIPNSKGAWNWLQPYSVPVQPSRGNAGVEEDEETKYNALEVGQDDGRLRLDRGPYTMVEGYLQLARRLEKADLES